MQLRQKKMAMKHIQHARKHVYKLVFPVCEQQACLLCVANVHAAIATSSNRVMELSILVIIGKCY